MNLVDLTISDLLVLNNIFHSYCLANVIYTCKVAFRNDGKGCSRRLNTSMRLKFIEKDKIAFIHHLHDKIALIYKNLNVCILYYVSKR